MKRPRPGAQAVLLCLAFAMALSLSACVSKVNYAALEGMMSSGNCSAAQGFFEGNTEAEYGGNQKLLYNMDAGSVSLYCRDAERAARYLQEAERLADELWTVSITKEGASYLVNDYTAPYAGEDFEKVMINLMASLNYTMAGNIESALVEARRLNTRLNEINSKYETQSVYNEDAFGRYLSGLLYESENPSNMEGIDNAFIDYQKAYQTYQKYGTDYGVSVPRQFMEDYFRVAEAAGRLGDVKASKSGVDYTKHKEAKKLGRLVLINLSGKVPMKVADNYMVAGPQGPVKLSFPKYPPPLHVGCPEVTLSATDKDGKVYDVQGEVFEDITAIAAKDLEDRRGRIIAKTILRAALKQGAVALATDQIDDPLLRHGAKLLGTLAANATEVADTRGWSTLPAKVIVAREFVAPGMYAVTVNVCGQQYDLGEVDLGAGKTKFLFLETIYSGGGAVEMRPAAPQPPRRRVAPPPPPPPRCGKGTGIPCR